MFLTKPTKRNCLEREVPHLWTMCPCIVPPTRICTGYPSRDLRCFTRNHLGQKNWSHQMMCLDLPYGWCVVSVSEMFLDTWKIKTQLVHFHVAPQFCEPCAALARPCFFLPILVPQQAVWDILSFTIVIPSKASHSATTIRDYQIIKNQMPRVKRCFKSFTIWLWLT